MTSDEALRRHFGLLIKIYAERLTMVTLNHEPQLGARWHSAFAMASVNSDRTRLPDSNRSKVLSRSFDDSSRGFRQDLDSARLSSAIRTREATRRWNRNSDETLISTSTYIVFLGLGFGPSEEHLLRFNNVHRHFVFCKRETSY